MRLDPRVGETACSVHGIRAMHTNLSDVACPQAEAFSNVRRLRRYATLTA
jgi:hypothetical protein